MATALLEAEKPAILLGHGFASGHLGVDIVELAERLQAPVATTLRGKGAFPEDHRLALGCVGLYGTRAANSYFRSGVDVLLSLGSSFHEFTSHVWDPAFQPTRALLQVDLDPAEIGKNYLVTHAITADAQTAAAALLVATAGKKRTGADIAEFKRKHKYLQEAVMTSDAVPIKPQRLMREISHVLPRNAVVLADIGNTVTWAERYLPCYPEGRFVTLSGLAAMGSATAAAVGCKLGRPGDPVVCLCGDGDFQMTGMEVATAVSHNIPVVWIILKNESLGMIHDVQGANYQSRYIATDLGTTDFVMLARALGAQAYRANSAPGVNEALSHALDGNGPAVIEVTIDEKEAPPMKPRMLALQRSMGLQKPVQALSWQAVKALFQMVKEK